MKPYPIPEGSLETVTKKQLKRYFDDNGLWYKMVIPNAMGNSVGMSDFQILHNGLFIAVEAKRNLKSAKPSKPQETYLQEVNKRGGYGCIVRSEEDIRLLDEELRRRGVIK
jgi:hypothetical protein